MPCLAQPHSVALEEGTSHPQGIREAVILLRVENVSMDTSLRKALTLHPVTVVSILAFPILG